MSGIGICGDAVECVAVFGAGLAAGLGGALWLKELIPIRVTARSRPAILCMNLLLKGASMLIIRRYLDRRRQSLPARLGLTAHKKFGPAAADTNSQKAHVKEKEAAKGLSS